jgi:hypothetical protein
MSLHGLLKSGYAERQAVATKNQHASQNKKNSSFRLQHVGFSGRRKAKDELTGKTNGRKTHRRNANKAMIGADRSPSDRH